MEALAPYIEILEEADELETQLKWLAACPHINYVSEEFQQAYFKEMQEQLNWFKENVEIVEEPERKVTQTIIGHKYLKYNI
jgi:RNA-splicing ligase RtcB